VAQIAASGLLLAVFPYLVPVLQEDAWWWWDNVWANLILYGAALMAVQSGVGRLESRAERRFWRFVGLALGSVLVVYVSWAVAETVSTYLAESVGMELFSQTCYLAFYFFLAFALDAERTVQEGSLAQQLRWVRGAGLGVLLAGALAYFAVVPTLVFSEDPVAWVPILLIYAAADAVLSFQALRARSRTGNPRWRRVMGWFALVMGTFAFVDFLEAAGYAGWPIPAVFGVLGDLQWFVPVLVLVLGARILLTDRSVLQAETPVEPALHKGGPLTAYALTLPILHLILYSTGSGDPEMRVLREVTVLITLVIVGILAFVYERKIQELNRISHAEAQASHERYSSFVETSVEGIWLLEFDPPIPVHLTIAEQVAGIYRRGRVVECNDAMAAMYGLENQSAMEGTALRDLYSSVKDSPGNAEAVSRFVTGGYRAIRDVIEYEDAAGRKRFGEGSLVGSVEDGALVRAWATQVDITPRFEAEAEKSRLEEQLRQSQKMETVGTLAGGIAHDFNNILAPILGFAELIEESIPPSDQDTRECLGQIKTAAYRGKDLVRQILAVGQRTENTRKPVAVRKVVQEAQTLLRQTLPSTVRFETRFVDPCPDVLADSSQIHQVVMNLCTNSGQAMPDHRGTVSLAIDYRSIPAPPEEWKIEPGDYVVLTVADDGRGMNREVRTRAFEPFFKGNEMGTGSGLGLSVTHGIVKGHGGHIELESEAGRGTKVMVYLPAAEVSAVSEATEAVEDRIEGFDYPGPVAAVPEEEGRSTRVMLVDDEESVLLTTERMMRRMGFFVDGYTDSAKARDVLTEEAGEFDILLTDHTMPEITGPQLAEVAVRENPSIAVVIASGHRFGDEPGSESRVVQLGKPFSIAELQASIEQARGLART